MLWIQIDRKINFPIIRQVYKQIRDKILEGELKANTKLPSSRELASFLQVSRNVILEAYNMLLSEGYIISKPNVGTFVSNDAVLQQKVPSSPNIPSLNETSDMELNIDVIDFRSGIPALDLLPLKKWIQVKNQVYLDSPTNILGYGAAEGRIELRQSICTYLQRVRGLSCHPDQIVITSSSIQSFSILSSLLLENNSTYIIEDPLHIEIKKVFSLRSTYCHFIPVDDTGIQTDLLPMNIDPKFVFVTPSHQYPLGGNLPIQRRIKLIEYARLKKCYIIEDDYDSEFNYTGCPISALYELDPNIVIYVGTFSKTLFPSIRIAYVVLPWTLVSKFHEYKRRSDYFTNIADQLSLSKFIDEKFLNHHIGKMKNIYKNRRTLLIETLKKEFKNEIEIKAASTGLHLVLSFNNIEFTQELVDFLYRFSIKIYPVWIHSSKDNFPKNLIIMGYSHLDKNIIIKGIKLLKEGLIAWNKRLL